MIVLLLFVSLSMLVGKILAFVLMCLLPRWLAKCLRPRWLTKSLALFALPVESARHCQLVSLAALVLHIE